MTITEWIVSFIALGTIVVMILEVVPAALVMLAALALLLLTGVISADQAFTGFSNPAPVTLACLSIMAYAFEKTGWLQKLVNSFGKSGSEREFLTKLSLTCSALSGFFNNTPLVAAFLPQVIRWANQNGHSPSAFLMPLSFATVLGGVTTLIGTSTNVVVSGLLEQANLDPIGMFELSSVGIPLAVCGTTAMIVLAPRLLKSRKPLHQQVQEMGRDFVVTMEVKAAGRLDGRTVEAGGLRHLRDSYLVEIIRSDIVVAPVTPKSLLKGGDLLVFVGKFDQVLDLQTIDGLISSESKAIIDIDAPDRAYFEAVVGDVSPVLGKTLKEFGFRDRYRAAVIAIHRAGQRVEGKLGDVKLRVGDTLLLLADSEFGPLWRDRNDFLLVSKTGASARFNRRRSLMVGAIVIGTVLSVSLGFLPMLNAALLATVLLVISRMISIEELKDAVDFNSILLVASSFALGNAIESSGLAQKAARMLLKSISSLGRYGLVFAVVLLTCLLTELISNNAAAVIMFPVVVSAAKELSFEPRPFVLAMTIAASTSFLTPIGYQTNTMVWGPGGYKFTDFTKLGAPLTLICVLILGGLSFWAWG